MSQAPKARPILLLNGAEHVSGPVRLHYEADLFRKHIANCWPHPVLQLPPAPRGRVQQSLWAEHVLQVVIPKAAGVLLIENQFSEASMIPAYHAYTLGLPVVAFSQHRHYHPGEDAWVATICRSIVTDLDAAMSHLHSAIAFEPNPTFQIGTDNV